MVAKQVHQCSGMLRAACRLVVLQLLLQKLVSPGTPRPPQPIQPSKVAEFVEGASQGLVLVAFGSTIQTIVMTQEDILQLARGFAALAPTRVLWAMSERGLPSGMRTEDLQLGPNTMLTPWVDYNVNFWLPISFCACVACLQMLQHRHCARTAR